jgi:oligopeptide/dipeptide ABC transporter ATP-binding protein
VVAELCDSVAIMYAGEVMERGDGPRYFHNSRHPYTLKLLECDPGPHSRADPHPPDDTGRPAEPRGGPEGCIFRSRCPERFDLASASRRRTDSGRSTCRLPQGGGAGAGMTRC